MSGEAIARPATPARRGVRVYALLGPGGYAAASVRLATLLFGIYGRGDAARRFSINETSGGIVYGDHGALWQGDAGLPDDPERSARAFGSTTQSQAVRSSQRGRPAVTNLALSDLGA